jgi:serine/threonine protein kinase
LEQTCFESVCRKSILTDRLTFKHACWASVTEPAKDFIRASLERDWEARPSALAALAHPWLASEEVSAVAAAPLASNVVARMQHYARRRGSAHVLPTQCIFQPGSSCDSTMIAPHVSQIAHDCLQKAAQDACACRDALQRTILPLIANELLRRLQCDAQPDASSSGSPDGRHASASQDFSPMLASSSLALARTPSSHKSDTDSLAGTGEGSGSRNRARVNLGGMLSHLRERVNSSPGLRDKLRARAESSPGLEALGSARGGPAGTFIRNRSDLFLAATAMHEGSAHGRSRMRRGLSTNTSRAGEQAKAARCDLARNCASA